MSESKLKKKQSGTNNAASVPGSATVADATTRHFPKKKLLIVGLSLLAVVAVIVLVVKLIDRPKTPAADAGLDNAISAVEDGAPASSYKTYDTAFSAGDIYDAKLKYKQAYAAYQQALKLTNKPPAELYINLGRTAKNLGNATASKMYYQKALTAYDAKTLTSDEVESINENLAQ